MKKLVSSIIKNLKKKYQGKMVVDFQDPYKVLIATIVSQRVKDETTEKISRIFFEKYPDVRSLARADLNSLRKILKPAGFFRQKSKHIKSVAETLLKKYNGNVPRNLPELVKLPGVGRKTANCVLVYAYKLPAIPVDTHVHRISNRIGLVRTKAPEETEFALMKTVPKRYWIDMNRLLVLHGKKTCLPRGPKCDSCVVAEYCWYKNSNSNIDHASAG